MNTCLTSYLYERSCQAAKKKVFHDLFQPSAVQHVQELKILKTKMLNSCSSSLTCFVQAALRILIRQILELTPTCTLIKYPTFLICKIKFLASELLNGCKRAEKPISKVRPFNLYRGCRLWSGKYITKIQ